MIDNMKLAEGAGWHWEKYTLTIGGMQAMVLLSPDERLIEGHQGYIPDRTPNFTESLDACFKYLVPGRVVEITLMYASDGASCDIEDLKGNFFEGHVDTESIEEAWTKSALAFCLAFEKLMEAKDDR